MLYVELLKALYGLLWLALISYNKLRGELEDLGCINNPYDTRIVNKLVKGLQLTVAWDVD